MNIFQVMVQDMSRGGRSPVSLLLLLVLLLIGVYYSHSLYSLVLVSGGGIGKQGIEQSNEEIQGEGPRKLRLLP